MLHEAHILQGGLTLIRFHLRGDAINNGAWNEMNWELLSKQLMRLAITRYYVTWWGLQFVLAPSWISIFAEDEATTLFELFSINWSMMIQLILSSDNLISHSNEYGSKVKEGSQWRNQRHWAKMLQCCCCRYLKGEHVKVSACISWDLRSSSLLLINLTLLVLLVVVQMSSTTTWSTELDRWFTFLSQLQEPICPHQWLLSWRRLRSFSFEED